MLDPGSVFQRSSPDTRPILIFIQDGSSTSAMLVVLPSPWPLQSISSQILSSTLDLVLCGSCLRSSSSGSSQSSVHRWGLRCILQTSICEPGCGAGYLSSVSKDRSAVLFFFSTSRLANCSLQICKSVFGKHSCCGEVDAPPQIADPSSPVA